MNYSFRVAGDYPLSRAERIRFRWAIEAHVSRFKGARSVGIGLLWRQPSEPPVSPWLAGSFVARQVRLFLPGVELYSLGERFVIRGPAGLEVTLEVG